MLFCGLCSVLGVSGPPRTCTFSFFGWLDGGLSSWLVGCLAVWLVGMAGCLAGWLFDCCLVGFWIVCLLVRVCGFFVVVGVV